jgi:lysophospholipase L1-like esterase
LRVRHIAGDPEIFGAFGEYVRPGVVLDTVGIDGARIATALAWDPEQYISAVKTRGLSLAVLAYGTNEVFDQTDVLRYVGHLDSILGRWRLAAAEVPCWVVGPPDSADSTGSTKTRVGLVTEVLRRGAAAQGCAFTSAYDLMGGEGSFAKWMHTHPPRARGDRIHLTVSGYEYLGQMLALDLASPYPSQSPLSPLADSADK